LLHLNVPFHFSLEKVKSAEQIGDAFAEFSIELRNQTRQIDCSPPLGHWLSRGIEELPCRIEGFRLSIPSAGDAQCKNTAPIRQYRHNVLKRSNHVGVPSSGLGFLNNESYGDGREGAGIPALIRPMNVVLRKTRASLTPTSGKHNPYSIQNRRLTSIVWSNEYSRGTQLNVEVSYRAKIFDTKPTNLHDGLPPVGPKRSGYLYP
jgi:hypothetical protein